MIRYAQIRDGEPFPDVGDLKPFKAIVVVGDCPTPGWQSQASKWLVRSGCRYMMAWGENCQSWDDSVDLASLEVFDFGDIPDEEFVITTWHDSEPLEDVFRYAKELARHPAVELDNTLILHVGAGDKQAELEAGFRQA